uniref:Uncharacterized protein n=1 Tax=Tetranychus urticae TaxID=32264 RepID=T1KY50_TETUR
MIILVTFTPSGNEASRRKIMKIKKLAALALLLKSKKKYIFPIPLPLPLPVPVIKKTVPAWPEPSWPEPSWPSSDSWSEPQGWW